ncbi:hypothetical protein [Lysinibacter cavernae]|uniref:AbiEi antitoxin C-terminal domain-containing protein n=1 Tax=Lysinibacter cavernae TaxID=1640652 RepID=A0A7X5QZ85_9MICO|nr:hypothetical protein [Lysinibacter cavernae]NIH52696.1 hypothetical protein [Lysinibacter cavernae]
MNNSQPVSFSRITARPHTTLPRLDTLSEAERCAARLDGVLFERGTHYEYSLPPLSAPQRAAALGIGPCRIIAGWNAAWVYGAARVRQPTIWVYERPALSYAALTRYDGRQLRRLRARLASSDVHTVGTERVTTPTRTAFDLIRTEPLWTIQHQTACRLLLLEHPAEGRLALRERLLSSHPEDSGAMGRLDSLGTATGDQPPFTR